jgi:hypothetical protein
MALYNSKYLQRNMKRDNNLAERYTSILIGPDNNTTTQLCKVAATRSEKELYLAKGSVSLGVMIKKKSKIGYDLFYYRYSMVDSQEEFHFKADMHLSVSLGKNGYLFYRNITEKKLINLADLTDLAYKADILDILSQKRIYSDRKYTTIDETYPVAHTLAEFDIMYAGLHQKYDQEPNWYTAIVLYLYLTLNALPLENIQLTETWLPLQRDLINAFSDGSPYRGNQMETDLFVSGLNSFAFQIRKLIPII